MEKKYLQEIKKELETQDNLSTADSIFVVYEDREYPTTSDYSEEWCYLDNYDGENKIGKTKEELFEYYNQLKNEGHEFDEELETLDFDEFLSFSAESMFEWLKENCEHCRDYLTEYYYFVVERFVSVFFTRKAAQLFIDKNSYHWTNPHIYVNSLWRNYEMQEIRNSLLNGELKLVDK